MSTKVNMILVEDYVVATVRHISEKNIKISHISYNLRIIILFECLWNLGIKRLNYKNKIEELYLLK